MNWPRRHPRTTVVIGCVVLSLLLQLPSALHRKSMERQIKNLKQEFATAIGSSADRETASAWLQKHQYVVQVGESSPLGRKWSLLAQRSLAGGNVFWRPAYIQLWCHQIAGQSPLQIDADLWEFPLTGRMDDPTWGVTTKFAQLLPMLAVIIISLHWFFSQLRNEIRIAHKRCPHCNYDLRGGIHERCPECGKAVTIQKA